MPLRPSGRPSRWLRSSAALLLVAVALAGCGPFGAAPYAFHGSETSPATAAPTATLTDQTGQPAALAGRDGRVTLLFFGFTNCPDVCPTTLVAFTRVKAALGERAADVDFVFVTVDPARDTPARLAEYLAFFDPAFTGLTGTPDQLLPILAAFGVYAHAQPPDASGDYNVDHTASSYVIDGAGDQRLTYAYGTDPAQIAEDLGHLLPD